MRAILGALEEIQLENGNCKKHLPLQLFCQRKYWTKLRARLTSSFLILKDPYL